MSAPPREVVNWLESASRVRYRRDGELGTVAAHNVALDKRQAWLSERKHELEFAHAERMIAAKHRWSKAMAEATENFCHKPRAGSAWPASGAGTRARQAWPMRLQEARPDVRERRRAYEQGYRERARQRRVEKHDHG